MLAETLFATTVERARSDVRRYCLYRATMSQGFIAPVIIEYVRHRGLSYSAIGLLTALFTLTTLLGEVPAGYLGDRLGRRSMLVAGSALTIVAMLTFGVSRTFAGFLAAYVVWAVGIVLRSGVAAAWLYDTLTRAGEGDAFTVVQGRAKALELAVSAVTALLGAWMATKNWLYPFVGNAGLYLCSIVAVFGLSTSGGGRSDAETFTPVDALPVVREFLSIPGLRSFVVYSGLFTAYLGLVATFTQPIATGIGIDISQLGWLYAGFSLVSAVVTFFSGAIERIVGIRWWFLSAPLCVGVLFVVAPSSPLVALFALFACRVARNVSKPLREQYLNAHADSIGRATILSTVGMISMAFMIGFRALGGLIANVTSPITMIVITNVAMLVGLWLLVVVESPVPKDVVPSAGSGDGAGTEAG
ncbi:MFS transporter [Natrinema altunense]|uniref:Putative sugar transporter n=1 Tax=Natrinema altunense (strain JCM 12890 / CGMCC 1.3731 / AJ2) TaxID=1227494 RepID=M0A2P4_NATA2|nr:MFS transporter [Natrinema altunense]ELY92132.1 putative sugar transporter [Natrinema altunense JCM 12890]